MQPDIVVILDEGQARVVRRGIECPPDLLVEVLSPANRVHDLLTKRALYARAGVREHLLVDTEARAIEILALDRDAFHQIAIVAGDAFLESPLLGPLAIPTDRLFPVSDA